MSHGEHDRKSPLMVWRTVPYTGTQSSVQLKRQICVHSLLQLPHLSCWPLALTLILTGHPSLTLNLPFSNIKVKTKSSDLPFHLLLHTLHGWHSILSRNNEGASPLFPWFLQTHSTLKHSSRLSLRDICSSLRLSSLACAFSYSAPGDLCCRLMKYIFRMLNMHINYPINGSDFLRAISLHCTRNIFEGSEEK